MDQYFLMNKVSF